MMTFFPVFIIYSPPYTPPSYFLLLGCPPTSSHLFLHPSQIHAFPNNNRVNKHFNRITSHLRWLRAFFGVLQKYWASEWLFCPEGRLGRVRGQPTACSHSTSAVCLDMCQLNAVMFGQWSSFPLTDS